MNKRFGWGIALVIILYIIIQLISKFYVDFRWFAIYDSLNIFWTLFFTKFNVHGAFSAAFIFLFFLNYLLIRLLGGRGRIFTNNILDRLQLPVVGSPRKLALIILTIGVVFVGFLMGTAASAYWKEYLMHAHAVSFSDFPTDPIFNNDLGFYVFSLPFYQFLYSWMMIALVILTAFSTAFHILNSGIFVHNGKVEFSRFARAHLSILLGSMVLLLGVGYRISAYQLLFSQQGDFFGAGYTGAHAQLLAYNVCMIISFSAAALLLANIFIRSFKLPIFVLLAILPAYFLLGTIFPSLQQRFVVDPNELSRERPFIENNIKFTRLAYDIERVKEIPYENNTDLTYNDIKKNITTFENIRLWDWRPLKQTYKQLQELKPYYTFNDIDVDRYTVNGEVFAMTLGARELDISKLPENSKTWTNKHLIYTHGYSLVANRVDKITPEGMPEMLIYDIPTKTKIPLSVDRPQVYYGEHKNPYVITNTSIKPGEFDYPSGDSNKYTIYKGNGGDVLDSFFKKLLYAISFGDINILISDTIEKDSRIMFRRNIKEMVTTLSPFLDFDGDPYIVLSEGKLYWILDAYTTSSKFPYSTPTQTSTGDINYIRNSVKVVIDAYNGSMNYYVMDDKDPIIQVYSRIFKGLFKPGSEMPDDLKMHIRYPEALFNIQSHILLKYHMKNPNVFYNNEDLWEIPNQVYDNTQEPMHSYYMVSSLPGQKKNEYILILPFTPREKDNMIGFYIAKCDPPDYGELMLYQLPKDKLSYGPMQIEARINQDADISKQLTLWSQKGSSVIRGNMLVIPVEESLIFIEPLYLKAERSEMPELKRVIVSYANRMVMEKDLDTALEKLFIDRQYTSSASDVPRDILTDLRDYSKRAYNHYMNAQKHMRDGNWSEYGKELDKLRETLNTMKNR
ncbi:MAG: UPF0182 family protein [Spirochaetota bacterium]